MNLLDIIRIKVQYVADRQYLLFYAIEIGNNEKP